MDQGTLLAPQQLDDGRRFVQRFAADGNSLKAAFWAIMAEEGMWFLYLVNDVIDGAGPVAAYRQVRNSLQKLGDSWISGADIKVISPKDPVALDILAFMTVYPGRMPTWLGSRELGMEAVEQVYIYPPYHFTFTQANPMTQDEIGRKLLELMSRGPGILQPSRITLRDGSEFKGVPFSLDVGPARTVEVSFIEDGVQSPRVVRIDEIASVT